MSTTLRDRRAAKRGRAATKTERGTTKPDRRRVQRERSTKVRSTGKPGRSTGKPGHSTSKPARSANKPARRAAKPERGERKSEATRRHLLDTALALFQEHGVDATTMRDIADAAGMSLGAAYYYFPSKEALVFAYYEANQDAAERIELAGSLREQLGTLMHARLHSIRDQRHMLGTILPRLVQPADPLSAFSEQTRAVRARSIELFARPLRDAGLPDAIVGLAAHALWLMQLGAMLVLLGDTSARQRRTHGLVDDGLDLFVSMLPMLSTPPGRQLVERIAGALHRAGLALA